MTDRKRVMAESENGFGFLLASKLPKGGGFPQKRDQTQKSCWFCSLPLVLRAPAGAPGPGKNVLQWAPYMGPTRLWS